MPIHQNLEQIFEEKKMSLIIIHQTKERVRFNPQTVLHLRENALFLRRHSEVLFWDYDRIQVLEQMAALVFIYWLTGATSPKLHVLLDRGVFHRWSDTDKGGEDCLG
jgi:hypothetical protein